jgi:hypothetical protein
MRSVQRSDEMGIVSRRQLTAAHSLLVRASILQNEKKAGAHGTGLQRRVNRALGHG